MDYPLENLGPEKFQHLVQALLVKEYPDVSCFPVGQADGGRDSTRRVFIAMSSRVGIVIYQVKFVRNPDAIKDRKRWLKHVLREEIEKAARLVNRGAFQYVLVTNVRGTGELNRGTMDALQEILDKSIPIPSVAWWRDDLNRRLDSAWDLKWVYPELMTGSDLIRAIFDSRSQEEDVRRARTLRSYLRDQYNKDREVRFKQVDLQNRLFDLFVDVPLLPPSESLYIRKMSEGLGKEAVRPFRARMRTSRYFSKMQSHGKSFSDGESIGAATFLLEEVGRLNYPKVVIEGAPGQGKSTIVQYVCQVQRIRLLEEKVSTRHLDRRLMEGAAALPFKIDLRDLAAWLSGRFPFPGGGGVPEAITNQRRSLETFLSAHITHYSGGHEFSPADLLAACAISSILLVFDGLDEIADIERRREVVAEIAEAVERLAENTASLQVIVTSRPAAFVSSPGLPEGEFAYFQLGSVTPALAEEYAEKWTKARNLQKAEAMEVQTILKHKMSQPHLRELSKNPMQLTILLSLIHTRGSSLPDKRTALYDSYMDLFFDREAEKSSIVRRYRDLLINIHRYLAWMLHGEAEFDRSGSISEERLKEVLGQYLRAEGYDAGLVEELFTGMVERVVALVSRVQGTFEFEVQPLREYFAARFLYETAPYSPAGSEQVGTKPDRFAAIARDFYWLNVARFYAGCYSKGELPSLIDGLEELMADEDFGLLFHPRTLGLTFLSDYVFSQSPNYVKRMALLLFSSDNLRRTLMAGSRDFPYRDAVSLPETGGNGELVRKCQEALVKLPPLDFRENLIQVLRHNMNGAQVLSFWQARMEKASERAKPVWLEVGCKLNVLRKLSVNQVEALLEAATDQRVVARVMLSNGQVDALVRSERLIDLAVDVAAEDLSIMGSFGPPISSDSWLALFLSLLSFEHFGGMVLTRLDSRGPAWTFEELRARCEGLVGQKRDDSDPQGMVRQICGALTSSPAVEWQADLRLWNNLVEAFRTEWGDQRTVVDISCIAAAIPSQEERGNGCDDLFDHTRPLVDRVRYARLRTGAFRWWARTLKNAGQKDAYLALRVVFSWASTRVLLRAADSIEDLLDNLGEAEWRQLAKLSFGFGYLASRASEVNEIALSEVEAANLGRRVRLMLFSRLADGLSWESYDWVCSGYSETDPVVLSFIEDWGYRVLMESNLDAVTQKKLVERISQGYFKSKASLGSERRRVRYSEAAKLYPELAKKVAQRPLAYPDSLVSAAEDVLKGQISGRIQPVSQIAARQQWLRNQ